MPEAPGSYDTPWAGWATTRRVQPPRYPSNMLPAWCFDNQDKKSSSPGMVPTDRRSEHSDVILSTQPNYPATATAGSFSASAAASSALRLSQHSHMPPDAQNGTLTSLEAHVRSDAQPMRHWARVVPCGNPFLIPTNATAGPSAPAPAASSSNRVARSIRGSSESQTEKSRRTRK